MLTQEAKKYQTGGHGSPGFTATLAANPTGLFFLDSEGRLQDINDRAADIFGFTSAADAVGIRLTQIDFFFSREIVDTLQDMLAGRRDSLIRHFSGTNMSGHFAHHRLACNRVMETERDSGVFGIIEDITESVVNQQELKCRIDELSVLSQISQAVASALDPDDVLKVILTGVTARQGLGFNRAFLFLLDDDTQLLNGYLAIGPRSPEEAGRIWGSLADDHRSLVELLSLYKQEPGGANQDLTERVADIRIDTTNGSLFARAIQDKRPFCIDERTQLDHVTLRVLDRLGDRKVAMTPLVSRGRTLGLLVVDNAITGQDISAHDLEFLALIADQTAAAVERSYLYRDIKERAEELEYINQRLAETQNQIIAAEKMSVIGEITSSVAHELRNPLTIIGGFANLMKRNVSDQSSEAEYLGIIVSETQRAEAVLTDLLDFSKASRTEDRQMNLSELVRQTVEMIGIRQGQGASKVKLDLSEQPLPIWGNPDQLIHAIYQILSSLVIEADHRLISLNTFAHGSLARLEIVLSAPGKGAERGESVLRQYFGTGNSSKRLPLLVAEETLKHHGGCLAVESQSDLGPMLCIHLPLKKEAEYGHDSGGR